ncbi:hypothetical protein CVV67_02560 [Arthrobacter stackebrandtii]|nr:hypothetical protein CVV67_02560 [Arthrobacter stackebrandtii]
MSRPPRSEIQSTNQRKAMMTLQRGPWWRRPLAVIAALSMTGGALAVTAPAATASEDTAFVATSGSLDWGVRKSFRDYLKSPIAHGTTVLGGGAIENADGTYRFPAAAVDPSAQTVAFGGSVSFSGHDDALAISIADIRLDLARGILIADVQSKSMGEDGVVTYADVDLTTLGSGEPLAGATISGGEAAGTALPTTLTESGAPAFASMYGAGSAFDPVTFTASYDVPVAIPVVAAPPVAQTVEVGQAVTFSADGTGYESVRWEASYNGSDWAPIDGASGATLTFTPLIADNGKQYRAVFINAGGEAPSDAALLTVTEPVVAAKPEVAASPAAASVKDGEDATFAAAGTGYESVQWQVSADGSEWADIAGAIAPTLTFTATVGGSGRQYRAAFTNGAGTVFSDAAVLTVAVAETVDPGPVEPEVPVFVPEVEVFAADGVTSLVGPVSEGTQIVVKGSGFDPAANVAPEGNRPPIAGGSPAGTYVVFGKFADVWQPSVSAPASARVVGDQKWALSQAAFDAVPAAFQGAVRGQWVEVSADGSFSTVLTVQKKVVSGAEVEWPEAGNFGVYTYAAGGTVNAAQELYAPVTVGGPGPVEPEVPVFVPEVEVFAADGVTSLVGPVSEGTQIVVKGSGFDPAANVAPEGNRPPIAGGSPAGTYVVFGKFADVWQPSVSAPASARVVGDQKWALSQAAFDAVPAAFQGAVRGQWVEVSADGSFSTVLTVQKKVVSGAEVEWPEAGNFGVYTYAAGGTVNAAQELYAPVTVGGPGPVEPEVPADKPTLTVEPATGLKHGSRVTVSGSGYGPSRWIYLAEVAQGPGGSDRPQDYENAARVKTNKDGTFGPIDFSVTTVFKNGGFNAVDGTLYIATFVSPLESDNEDAADRSQDAFVELAWADPSAPVVTEPEIPEFTLPKLFSMNTTVAAGGTLYLSGSDFAPGSQLAFDLDGNAIEVGTPASTEISGGLDWGVRASFRGYLEGNIAKGTITASEGATINGDGTFHFPAASYDADGKVAGYAGTLSMVGHEGALQVNLSNLRVDAKNKQLIADVVSKSLTGASENFTDVALVAIGATSLDGDGNGLSGKNLSTVLTEAGAPAFASFYEAGESFDALSFDIHEETVLNSLLVGEDGSFSGQWPVPATQKAGSYTLTATATAPQQARALVTAGVQTASMMLEVTAAAVNPGDGKDDEVAPELPPATVGPSKPVEKPVDTLPPVSNVPADAKCTNGTIVDGALVWGVKESFRKYITGNIADGNITFNGAEVSADQVFTFSNGIGTIDSTKRTGEVRFDGVASFQGHDYGSGAVLSVTISNVTLVLDGNAGSLKADVVSRSLESATEGAAPGGDVNYASVVLAELDLSSASLAGGGVAYAGTNIPAVLASSGVAPFADFYAAGDAMDPLSFILGCSGAAAIDVVNGGATGAPTDAPTASATAQPVPGTTATTAPTTVAAASAGTLAKTGATGMDAAVIGAIMILLLGAGVIAGNRATGRRRHS